MPGSIRASDSSKWALRLLEEKNTKFAPVLMWEKRTRRFYLIVKYVAQRLADTKPPEEQVPIPLLALLPSMNTRQPCTALLRNTCAPAGHAAPGGHPRSGAARHAPRAHAAVRAL